MATSSALPLSVVLPVHENAAPLLRRTLRSLREQSADPGAFEVVVAADGGDPRGTLDSALREVAGDRPWRLVSSPRPKGALPHRNHARNAGCRSARGDLLWVLDADFLLPPHAIEHLLHEDAAARRRGQVACFTPCLARIDMSPPRWLEHSSAWAAEAATQADCLGDIPLTGDVYCGYYSRARPPQCPFSAPCPKLKEGFPTCLRVLWDSLGAYDERFIGFGGNKEEFVRRLAGLARGGLLELRLLSSVVALHQPHPPDPQKVKRSVQRQVNRRRFRGRVREIENRSRWWRDTEARCRATLQAWRCAGGSSAD